MFEYCIVEILDVEVEVVYVGCVVVVEVVMFGGVWVGF